MLNKLQEYCEGMQSTIIGVAKTLDKATATVVDVCH